VEPSTPVESAAPSTRVVMHDSNGAVMTPAPTKPAPPSAVDPVAKIAEGDSALAAKDFRIALYAYQDAILADPKNVAARVKAGNVYAKMGHDPEAIEQWNRALTLEPTNVEAQDALAAAYARRAARTPAPAGTTIVTVGSPAPNAVPAAATAPAAAPLSAPPAAPVSMPSFAPAPAAAPASSGDETAARQHYSAGVGLMHDRKYEAAVAELDQAIALRPGYANALIARGSARISLGRFAEAAQDYAAARSAEPTLAAPLFGLAEAYRQMGDSGRAIEMYRAFAESNAADAQPNLKSYARQTADSLSRK
jgi:tetratricopeptide (TPR) repeat protein